MAGVIGGSACFAACSRVDDAVGARLADLKLGCDLRERLAGGVQPHDLGLATR